MVEQSLKNVKKWSKMEPKPSKMRSWGRKKRDRKKNRRSEGSRIEKKSAPEGLPINGARSAGGRRATGGTTSRGQAPGD